VEHHSELWDRPGLGVRQCSELGDSSGEQVRLGHPPGEQGRFGLAFGTTAVAILHWY